jgi:hypothetical protein
MFKIILTLIVCSFLIVSCKTTKKEPLPEPEQLLFENIPPFKCYDVSNTDYEKGLCDQLFKDRFIVKNLTGTIFADNTNKDAGNYVIIFLDEKSYKSIVVDKARFPHCNGTMEILRAYNCPAKLKKNLKNDIKVKIDINLFYSDVAKNGLSNAEIPCTPIDLLRIEILK